MCVFQKQARVVKGHISQNMRADNMVGNQQMMTNVNKTRGEEENFDAVSRNETEGRERSKEGLETSL